MGAERGFSVEQFHEWLWRSRNSQGIVRLNQHDLAEQLMISRFLLNRHLRTMQDQGKIVKLGNPKSTARAQTFRVLDPADQEERDRGCGDSGELRKPVSGEETLPS